MENKTRSDSLSDEQGLEARRGDLRAVTTEAVIRIAWEGREFGLYLLLASQRSNKICSNVLSQCDNRVLMRMNSHAGLARLASILSAVPISPMEQSIRHRMGESLLASRICRIRPVPSSRGGGPWKGEATSPRPGQRAAVKQ